MSQSQEWMTAKEAAAHIGITIVTLHRWRQRGTIFAADAVKEVGILQPEYHFRRDEVERLREKYGAKNDFAVAA